MAGVPARGPCMSAAYVAEAAVAHSHHYTLRGILARKVAAYGLPHHVRITIGTGEEMEIVAAALAEFMEAA